MKNHDTITLKSNPSSAKGLISFQLAEALRLIGQLQRNNAELIRQNTHLMNINSRLISGKANPFMQNSDWLVQNDDDVFINDILSLINDKSTKKIDKKAVARDNNSFINDNKLHIIDKNVNRKDKKTTINESKSAVNDNIPEQIDINGKLYVRKFIIERLRFAYNVKLKQNFTDDELIETYKKGKAEEIKAQEKIQLEKLRKVPALFYLDHEPRTKLYLEPEFEKVFSAYRKLKRRNKKNTPSLIRQVKMLLLLYKGCAYKPQQIFATLKLKPITGFRCAAKLRNHGLINCSGRGNSCQYHITETGNALLENASASVFCG